jgi:hypothetical protein
MTIPPAERRGGSSTTRGALGVRPITTRRLEGAKDHWLRHEVQETGDSGHDVAYT